MVQRVARFVVLAGALVLVAGVLAASAPAPAQEGPIGAVTYAYAVEFACGEAQGFHATAIQVHNPSPRERAVFAGRIAGGRAVSEDDFERGTIRAGRAIAVGCNELGRRLPGAATDGFHSGTWLLYSTVELEVTAVYTSRPPGGAAPAIDVAVIPPRQMERPLATTG